MKNLVNHGNSPHCALNLNPADLLSKRRRYHERNYFIICVFSDCGQLSN